MVTRLNEAVNTGLRDKSIAEKLEVQGIVPRPMTAPEYRAFVGEPGAVRTPSHQLFGPVRSIHPR